MDILEKIIYEFYEKPIKGNAEYDELCQKRDELESSIIKNSNKEIRELFKQYIRVADNFLVVFVDYAMEFLYNKIKEILQELAPAVANKL